jgi:hypothetical protein
MFFTFCGLQVNFFIGAFYDGVYLLGMALNETLSEGGDIHNGTAITRRMWNRDFHGNIKTSCTIGSQLRQEVMELMFLHML